jgi:nucleoid DNA-binding protein
MGKMNGMTKATLMKLSGEVNTYGKNKLPASKSQSTGRDPMPKLSTKGAAEAVGEIFDGDDLSEDFRSKAATIFEATVNTKLIELHVHMQEEFSQKLEEDKETFRKELTDRVDEYLDYVTEEWMKENEVAIENALKVEVAETFMNKIKDLFTENYISVPEEKVDLVAELEKQKEELEGKLEEQINKSIDSKKATDELERYKTFSEACSGLTMTQIDKLSKLSEGIEYESNDEYKSKIDLLKEHYFTNKSAKSEGDLNSEPVELDSDEPQITGSMAAYTSAISRSVRK